MNDDLRRASSEWVFYSADFSVNAADSTKHGHVTLTRDPEGAARWHALSEEEQEETALFAVGRGLTFAEAFRNAECYASKAREI